MEEVQVQSLVRELKSHMPYGQKQCWNEFNKDFKNGPHQKKNLKKKQLLGVRPSFRVSTDLMMTYALYFKKQYKSTG